MSVPSKRSLLAMDLEQMTVAELKEILRSLNLPLVGNKAELIEKIEYMARTMPESVFQYDDIKGLDPLINWSKMTGRLFSPEAAAYGFTRFQPGSSSLGSRAAASRWLPRRSPTNGAWASAAYTRMSSLARVWVTTSPSCAIW